MSALGTDRTVESLSQRRELSDAAKALLADKAFGHVWRKLHEQWIKELLLLKHAGPEQDELATRLRTLDLFLTELSLLLKNYQDDARKEARRAS